jgi:hypothetical protein
VDLTGGGEAEWWSVWWRRRGGEAERWSGGEVDCWVDAAVFIAGETGNLKPNFLNLLFETYFENKVTPNTCISSSL